MGLILNLNSSPLYHILPVLSYKFHPLPPVVRVLVETVGDEAAVDQEGGEKKQEWDCEHSEE